MPKQHQENLDQLIKRYLTGKATPEEILFVEKYYDWFDRRAGISAELTPDEKQLWQESLYRSIQDGIKRDTAPMIPLYRRLVFRVAAAAAILIIAVSVYWLYTGTKPVESTPLAAIENDILPGSTKATLILADGRRIALDTAHDGLLAQEGTTGITNNNGELVYAAGDQSALMYNTLVTHKGEQYPLVLSDGTRIIVDASTTIRFPVAFTGKDRTVEINGRAWFEVAKDAAKPFYVIKGDTRVEVLGTQFDVNAFDNEGEIRITLVEGKVKVKHQASVVQLVPGQQAVINRSNDLLALNRDPDVEEALAWKNGQFIFHSADVAKILREIERWYDVDVEIRGTVPQRRFVLEGSRGAKLSEILRGFEVNKIPFKIDGAKRRLIVNP